MKFTHLQPGQRFRWQDQVYCKTGPLTAVAETDGGTRMFSRSALITLLDGSAPVQPATGQPTPERIRSALDTMTTRLEQAAAALAQDAGIEHATALRSAIDEARQGFIQQAGL